MLGQGRFELAITVSPDDRISLMVSRGLHLGSVAGCPPDGWSSVMAMRSRYLNMSLSIRLRMVEEHEYSAKHTFVMCVEDVPR